MLKKAQCTYFLAYLVYFGSCKFPSPTYYYEWRNDDQITMHMVKEFPLYSTERDLIDLHNSETVTFILKFIRVIVVNYNVILFHKI